MANISYIFNKKNYHINDGVSSFNYEFFNNYRNKKWCLFQNQWEIIIFSVWTKKTRFDKSIFKNVNKWDY